MDIEKLFNEEITGVYKDRFEAYRGLILEYNQRYNLTTILEEKDMYYKHFLDSAAGAELFKKNGKVAGLVVSIVGEVCSVISSLIGIVSATGIIASIL